MARQPVDLGSVHFDDIEALPAGDAFQTSRTARLMSNGTPRQHHVDMIPAGTLDEVTAGVTVKRAVDRGA